MTNLPAVPSLAGFIKPTLDTLFHIDYDWWVKRGVDLNVELVAHLCPEHKATYAGQRLNEKIDWIDMQTGEVKQIEGLQYLIQTHCSRQPDYTTQSSTLVEGIFRIFLSNGNQPLSPRQLAGELHQSPEQILRTLSGEVRKGMRPMMNP